MWAVCAISSPSEAACPPEPGLQGSGVLSGWLRCARLPSCQMAACKPGCMVQNRGGLEVCRPAADVLVKADAETRGEDGGAGSRAQHAKTTNLQSMPAQVEACCPSE